MPSKRPLAGFLLLAMIILSILADVVGAGESNSGRVLMFVAGACGWIAAMLLLPQVRRYQLVLVVLLLIVGLALMAFSWQRSGNFDWHRMISINAGLLTMIISVGFLKLVAVRGFQHEGALPVGRKAFRETMLTVAVFGSFINISAPVLVADRLALNRPLTLFGCSLLTRTFSGCSSWSPFFGGMAVVLTYVEGMRIVTLMGLALPFALIGLVVIYVSAMLWQREAVDTFRGYPMQLSSLWIPAALAMLVVSLSFIAPDLSILSVIALGSLLLTISVLLVMDGAVTSMASLKEFVLQALPNTANELTLFLSAGVLAVGLSELVDLGILRLPLSVFGAREASLLLVAMVLVAAAGIHPVVQVAAITPLVVPLSPDPQLLALTFMFVWSLGTCASPLSGTHLIMQGRYGIASWRGALVNWPFVGVMLVVAIAMLYLTNSLR